MAAIPLHVKITLLNNYIQANYLKSRGKAKHDDWLISEILESVKSDLEELSKTKEQQPGTISLELVLRDLKHFKDKEAGFKSEIESAVDQITSALDSQKEPEQNLDSVIKSLEEFSKNG